MAVRQEAVAVDGVELHCEIVGAGSPLLVIQGGVSDAGGTAGFVEHLARKYTVITYDRRGLSRSPAPIPPRPGEILEQHADDAAALLARLEVGPCRVVGASIGAVIGLHLLVRSPNAVSGLLAHEPPLPNLVRDPEREAGLDQVQAKAAEGEHLAAVGIMGKLTEPDPETEPGVRPARPLNLTENLAYFFAHDFTAVRSGTLDPSEVAAAARGRRVCLTGGVRSRGRWEYRCASALAALTGAQLLELPGGHNGLASHPQCSAALVDELVGSDRL
ncbi:alpha/beta fold hydrolase [Pseudonocardia sp. WMMC193]|uniref:alpha/beta fold hydrolase n=1 Tax=Pseudonocardia sp. WMMC193 TaxID=2911965 RepID=UPI001F368A34|nr:alpha/beta hydrolase [Pseudonocardia sp. WMMC193]MCF7552570.1 alpha/beta hydrolase [Pseudonocardia sp. WMMC193]